MQHACVNVRKTSGSVSKSCVDLRQCSSFSIEVVSASLDVPAFQETSCGVWVAVQYCRLGKVHAMAH